MKNLTAPFVFLAVLILAAPVPTAAAETAETAAGDYQIVKATDTRVWRLNRQTGEIAVCTLDGDGAALICMNSAESVKPPVKDYATLEAERQAAAERDKAKRDADLARDLAFLDRMVDSFKTLIKAAMEREQAEPETQP